MVSQEVKDELFAGVWFGHTLEELGLDGYTYRMKDVDEDREFVMGTAGRRGSLISSSDGMTLLCVYDTLNDEPPFDEPQLISREDIPEHLPYKLQSSGAYKPKLSLKGQYLKVREWDARVTEDENGDEKTILKSRGTTSYWIPVEWVRMKVEYDMDIVEFQ
jgi:hypothetical protein